MTIPVGVNGLRRIGVPSAAMPGEAPPRRAEPADEAPVRIVLVDDHAILRQGLRSLLEREHDLQVVGEASSAGEALAVVERTRPRSCCST